MKPFSSAFIYLLLNFNPCILKKYHAQLKKIIHIAHGRLLLWRQRWAAAIVATEMEKQGTEDRIIAYASKTLSKSQRNYSATKRELFAIVHFSHYFKNYLIFNYLAFFNYNGPQGSRVDL